MKYFLLVSLFVSHTSWSRIDVNFNQALNEDLKTEIKKDDFKFKKKSHRAPASVEEIPVRPVITEPPKIDKNIRQIGPQKW